MSPTSLMLIAVCLLQTDVAVKMPNCGVMAAFSLMNATGSNVRLKEIADKFPNPSASTASVLEVRNAIEACGVRAHAVKYNDRKLASVTLPAVLHFDAHRWSKSDELGHFVTVLEVRGDTVVLLDWSKLVPDRIGNTKEIEAAWDGAAIVVERGWSQSMKQVVFGGLAMIMVAFVVLTFIGKRPKSRIPLTATVILVMLSAGCGRSKAAVQIPSSPITCAQPFVNCGEVPRTKPLVTKYVLNVAKDLKGPVVIKRIHSSCGCTSATADLVGKPLDPGSTHELEISIRPDGDGSATPLTRITTIETSPPSNPPLTVAAQFWTRIPPVINQIELLAESNLNEPPVVEFQVTARRPPTESPFQLVRDRSSFGPFEIADIQLASEVVDRGKSEIGQIAFDRLTVRLKAATRREYGEERGSMLLTFSDGTSKPIPWRIRVAHPVSSKQPHYFVGNVKLGEQFRQRIQLIRGGERPVTVLHFVTTPVGTKSEMLNDDEFEIVGYAPQSTGRFEGSVEVTFSDMHIPALRIPFAGIAIP